jgi:hypothetical protein
MLTDMRCHSSTPDTQPFTGAECNNIGCKITDRMLVNKWEMQTFDIDRFHLKKLNDTKIYKKYLVTISNRYACLQDFDDCGDTAKELKTPVTDTHWLQQTEVE